MDPKQQDNLMVRLIPKNSYSIPYELPIFLYLIATLDMKCDQILLEL